MTDDSNLPAPLTNFTPEEIGWLLRQLARRREFLNIKDEFDKVFAPTVVNGRDLMLLKKYYPEEYRLAERAELADISSVALAHVKLRMEEIQQGLNETKEPVLEKNVRVTNQTTGEDEWVPVYTKDHAARQGYLRLAREEEAMMKNFWIKVKELDQDMPEVRKSGFITVNVNPGNFDDDDEVVVTPKELDGQEGTGETP